MSESDSEELLTLELLGMPDGSIGGLEGLIGAVLRSKRLGGENSASRPPPFCLAQKHRRQTQDILVGYSFRYLTEKKPLKLIIQIKRSWRALC